MELYSIEEDEIFAILTWLIDKTYERDPELYENIITELLNKFDSKRFSKEVLKYDTLNSDIIYEPAVYLLHKSLDEINQLILS